jgi:hypothetical protein
MRKWIALTMVVLLVSLAGLFVYGESVNEVPQWFNDMIEWKKGQVDEALKDGIITEEEAALRKTRIEAMEERHIEKGFGFGMGMEGCKRNFGRKMGMGRKFGGGLGSGMMNRLTNDSSIQ